MAKSDELIDNLARTRLLFQERIGGSGDSLSRSVDKRIHRLPRWVRKRAKMLSEAEAMLAHPRLRFTQDEAKLSRAADELETYLKSIDLADQRKGRWLVMLGAWPLKSCCS